MTTKCARCDGATPSGARFCPSCGAPLEQVNEARHDAPRSANGEIQRRHITVMFCDLVGSTVLAERLDPEEFHEILGDYQRACTRAIQRLDGYPARFIGDGIVAFFGYPHAYEDDAQRAAHAGLGILTELEQLNVRLRLDHDVCLQVRIALHTGLTVAGQMGPDPTREELDIVGETPHLAARLQTIAPPDSVVVSDETQCLIDGYFETEPLGERMLKGISRPIGVHRLVRATGAVRLDVSVARRLTPLVGRDGELARLEQAWQQAHAGRGGLVQIRGEAGIGKSRLARELLERIAPELGAAQTWQCSAHHHTTFLYPVARVAEQMSGRSIDELAPGTLAPREARAATLKALISLLVADATQHPLLLLVEDLHWADPSTLELLERIAASIDELPVLCILTFRNEFEPPWQQPALDIELRRLGDEQVRIMAGAISAVGLDDEVLERVQSAADGVPLFVEEVVRMIELPDAPSAPALLVPPTLRGLLTERLDRLPDFAGVIDVAAVIGREFERPLLAALGPLPDPELDVALAALATHDVIRPVQGSGSRCEFTHALLQEAAYERVLRRRREALHCRVAESLVGGFATVAEREPEVVAHHFSFGQQHARAVGYWGAAGTRALERAAFLEAAEHFRRGLEELDTMSATGDELERVDFLTHRAAALQAGRGYAAGGVGALYEAARSGCERAGSTERLAKVIRGEWMLHLLRGEYAAALELADEMMALGGAGADSAAEGHMFSGLAHMYLANFELARANLEQAIAGHQRPERPDLIYEAQGDTGVGSRAYLAMVLLNLGEFEPSLRRSDESIALAERVGGPVTRAQSWFMRSIYHLARGEAAPFSEWIEKTRAYSAEGNIGYWRTVSALFDGWRAGRSGDVEAGIRQVQDCLEAYVASGSRLSLPQFTVLLADLRLLVGDAAGALQALADGEEYLEQSNEGFSESELFVFKGRALMAIPTPDPAAAGVAYRRGLDAAVAQRAPLLQLRALTQLLAHQQAVGESTASTRAALSALCDELADRPPLRDLERARRLARVIDAG